MMKKLIAIALLAGCSSVALADQDAGCGLGSMVFEGKSGVAPKLLAATTNDWAGQVFSITTGTFGCEQDGVVSSRAKLGMFTSSNVENLARDMSVGHGDSLNVVADLMGIKDQDKSHFFETTKANFSKIFAPENKTTGQILAALHEVMVQDSTLAHYAV